MASSSCSTTITVLPRSRRRRRVEQAVVVALVQADRGLVEHVHHAGEAGADLAGEADALRLAAGQGVGGAVERQVVEADVDQELQPAGDLA
jgi:aminoglycoside phosphotransferase